MTNKIKIIVKKIDSGDDYGNVNFYDAEKQLQVVSDLYSYDNIRARNITKDKETQRYLEGGESFVIEIPRKKFNRLYARAKTTENRRNYLNKNKLRATGLDWELLQERELKDHQSFRAFFWNNIGDI